METLTWLIAVIFTLLGQSHFARHYVVDREISHLKFLGRRVGECIHPFISSIQRGFRLKASMGCDRDRKSRTDSQNRGDVLPILKAL